MYGWYSASLANRGAEIGSPVAGGGKTLLADFAVSRLRTQAQFQLHGGYDVGDLLRAPPGKHLIVVSGHHLTRLKHLPQTMIIVAQTE